MRFKQKQFNKAFLTTPLIFVTLKKWKTQKI
jgi:hypothetical protein